MLEAIRKYAYSWPTRIFLLLLAGLFTVFFGGISSYFARVKPIATVNCRSFLFVPLGSCTQILSDDIDRQVSNLTNTINNVYGKNADNVLHAMNLRQTAVEQLIQQALILEEAHRLGLSIGDEALARTIESQAAFQTNGHFDDQRYNEILASNNLEPAGYESETRDAMLSDALRQMVSSVVQVSADEAHHAFNATAGRINLAYVEVPFTNFTAAVNPSPAVVAKFYADNRPAFSVPEQIKITLVRYDPAVLAAGVAPSDEDVQNYYDQNLKNMFTHTLQVRARHILIPVAPDAPAADQAAAKAKAAAILAKLKAGADFAALAKQYSSDPGSKDKGGELGFFGPGELVKPFEDAAFGLKPGQYAIAQTQYGFHVIEVEEVKPAGVDTPEQARPKIVEALKQKLGADTAKQYLEQDLTAALTGHGLAELANKRGLKAIATPLFAADEKIAGAEDNPQLGKEAFGMSIGEVRAITDGPTPYLVKLDARVPAHIPPLAEINDLVRRTIIRVTAESRAHDTANAMLRQINSPADFDRVAAANHLTVSQTGDFPRYGNTLPGLGAFPGVINAAAMVATVPGTIDKVMQNGGNSYLFKVLSRTPPSAAEWQAASASFTERMLEQRRASAWINFVNDLKSRAEIVIHADQLSPTNS
ncbi:MAG: peptidylprolyl isomerase [Candidatus Binataceae bacterium]|nr:peptidylprolyl isomerase [Candidatus Binataceae bacterium]